MYKRNIAHTIVQKPSINIDKRDKPLHLNMHLSILLIQKKKKEKKKFHAKMKMIRPIMGSNPRSCVQEFHALPTELSRLSIPTG